MGGLLVLFLFGLYLWVAYKLVRKSRPVWLKVIVVLVFVLIPTADAVYGRVKLREMCKSEGSLKIYKTVEGVDGFYEPRTPDEAWILKHKFTFAEGRGMSNGKDTIDRLILTRDGSTRLEKDVTPRSKYRFRFVPGNRADIYLQDDFYVETFDSGEVLGRMRNYNYAGGWIERFIATIYAQRGSAGTCELNPNVRELQRELILATLRPLAKLSGGGHD